MNFFFAYLKYHFFEHLCEYGKMFLPDIWRLLLVRLQKDYEAYLDEYEYLIVYMKKNFYNGRSNYFYLKDQDDNVIPLTIKYRDHVDGYTKFRLLLEEPITIGNEYYVVNEHGRSVICEYGHIVKTDKFYEDYYYDGDDLGLTYTKSCSVFKLWSPVALRIKLCLEKDGVKEDVDMIRKENGIFEVSIYRDLHAYRYTYMVRVNGTWREIADPYSSFCGPNIKYSIVEDVDSLPFPEKIETTPLESYVDAIIYEANIRDMTSQKRIGVHYPRTFYGFTEENEITRKKDTGFHYLKSLGITHVQIMPSFFFGSVNDMHPDLNYNWGYDPMHFRVPEGSYSLHPAISHERVMEFANLVKKLHKENIKVNLDVVFNHVYVKEDFALEQLVPNYYFLMDRDGKFSNGSFCGNDIDTQAPMCRKYFLDTVERMIKWYDIDGLRFDLMGVLDYKFMNEVEKLCHSLKPDFMIYGEGWNMPSFVPDYKRASQNNQDKMERIGHFSDRFREVFKGSNGELDSKGFVGGRTDLIQTAKQCMMASCIDYYFDSPEKVVNYVECHDNHTLWDKLKICCSADDEETLKKRQILANSLVLLAQGIPFLHAGQEFCRTKKGIGNSYNRKDTYNLMDYTLRDKNIDVVNATKKLIEIRKNHPCFRLRTRKEMKENVYISTILDQVLVYNTRHESDHCIVYFNPTDTKYEYVVDRQVHVLFDSGNNNYEYTHNVQIEPYSIIVCQF